MSSCWGVLAPTANNGLSDAEIVNSLMKPH